MVDISKNFKLLFNFMSSELHKYINTALDKKFLNAEVINFPNDKTNEKNKDFTINNHNFWKISDKSNTDQLKAVTGICFMFAALIIMGLYSNLI